MREIDAAGGNSMTHGSGDGGIVTSGGGPTTARNHSTNAARDAADVAEAVAQANARRQALRLAGRGTWLDAGRPVHSAHRLDLGQLAGIVEYVPGDLTLTALAGTTLAQIAAATAAHGQWLPLDPFGTADSTLGATLATASTGPLGGTIGLPRDVTLGIEVVSGQGERIRAGGRVVKNVAGFDLVRLQVGAWGTLGVITEATVRLRGRADVDRTVVVMAPEAPQALADFLRQLRHLRATPLAAEVVNGPLARRLGVADRACVLVRLAGNEDAVVGQVRMLSALGDHETVRDGAWSDLAAVEPSRTTVVRVSGAPAALASTWRRALASLPGANALVHATSGRGIVRIILDESVDAVAALHALRDLGTCVVERGPAAAWPEGKVGAIHRLSLQLRLAFDPAGILNPGILA